MARRTIQEVALVRPLDRMEARVLVMATLPNYLLARYWEWKDVVRRIGEIRRGSRSPTGKKKDLPLEQRLNSATNNLVADVFQSARYNNSKFALNLIG